MRKDEVGSELSQLAFEFFFWFSRFEFALKENHYLKSDKPGENAEPGWTSFTNKWRSTYKATAEANRLLQLAPERQVVAAHSGLEWKPVSLTDCKHDLEKVVRLLKTVRNNLFHGGKHGGAGWDDPKRTKELLLLGREILGQLANVASVEDDYKQLY